jgi:hypothetical protein
MEQTSIFLENVDFEKLLSDFQGFFRPKFHISASNNTTYVFIVEQFYMRTLSNLTITVVFERLPEYNVKIQVMVSGGAVGFLQLSWGSERSALKKVTKFFNYYLSSN